jgi:hypothetical protein
MQPLKAHVKNGRLTLDEPTDLPEGQVVYLQRIDGFDVIDRDGLDDDDQAALHAELEASISEAESGHTEDFAQVLSELRQPR